MDKNKIIQAATKFVQKGQYDKAIGEYQKILKEDPRDVRILLKVGELHQKRGDEKLAAATLLKVAESYSADGFFLKAVAVYKQILKLDANRVDVNLKLAELYQQLGLMSDAMGQFQLVVGFHERAGNSEESLQILRRIVELDPDNVAFRVKLAELFAQQGNHAEALVEFRRGAEALREQKRTDDYVKVGERIVFLAPDDLELTRELAKIYLEKSDTKRALAKLQSCFKADPRDVETLRMLAKAFLELGQTSKTVAVYKELAKVQEDSGDTAAVQSTWKRIAELAPDDEEAREVLHPGSRAAVASRPATPGPAQRISTPPPQRQAPAHSAPAPTAPARTNAPIGGKELIPKLLTETDVYVKYGLHEKALEHLAKVFEIEPGNLDALEKTHGLHEAKGNHERANEALVELAKRCAERGELARGEPYYLKLCEEAPELAELPALREAYGALSGASDAAELVLDEAFEDEPFVDEPLEVQPLEAETIEEEDAALLLAAAGEASEVLVDEPLLASGDEEIVSLEPSSTGDAEEVIEVSAVEEEPITLDESVVTMDAEPFDEIDPSDEPTPGPDDFDEGADYGGAEAEARPEAPAHVEAPVAEASQLHAGADGLDDEERSELETELEEADFFLQQEMLDEAEDIVRSALFRAPNHQGAKERLTRIGELRRAAAAASAPAQELIEDGGFDLGAELASELDDESAEAAPEDFQYSVQDVFEEFKKGVSQTVKPEDTQTHYDLGIAYREMGLLPDAITEFEVALAGCRGQSKEIDCHTMIAACRTILGEPRLAVASFEAALAVPAVTPETAKAIHYDLAAAHEAAGNAAEALAYFERVAATAPSYRDVRRSVERLQAAGVVAAKLNTVEVRDAGGQAQERSAGNGSGKSPRKIGYV